MEKETQFTGVWVPEKMIKDKRLLPREKIVAGYVYSLCQTTEGCFASNEYLADLFDASPTWISKIISKLKELEYCYLENFNGKKRVLRSRVDLKIKADLNHSSKQTCTPVQPYNKDYNKVDISLENNDNGVGKEAKICLDYYFQKHLAPPPEGRGFKPTISGATEIKLLKILLRNFDVPAIKEQIDTFFAWKRTDYTFKRFYNRFDVLYDVNKAKAEGRR